MKVKCDTVYYVCNDILISWYIFLSCRRRRTAALLGLHIQRAVKYHQGHFYTFCIKLAAVTEMLSMMESTLKS